LQNDFERILEIATKYFTAIPSVAAVCIAIPNRACSKVFLPVLQNANTRNTFLAITGLNYGSYTTTLAFPSSRNLTMVAAGISHTCTCPS